MAKKSSITISVGSGSPTFGNIVQGDNSRLSLEQSINTTADFNAAIAELQRLQGISDHEVQSLKSEVDDLLVQSKKGDSSTINVALEALFKNYGWAIKPLKALFESLF